MKTNGFEDNLRKKLSDFESEFKESDWNRFKAYVRTTSSSGSSGIGQNSAKWLVLATTCISIMAAAASGLYYHQIKQNELLKNEIKSLKKAVESLAPTTNPVADTVYIVKTIDRYLPSESGPTKSSVTPLKSMESGTLQVNPEQASTEFVTSNKDQEIIQPPASLPSEKVIIDRVEPIIVSNQSLEFTATQAKLPEVGFISTSDGLKSRTASTPTILVSGPATAKKDAGFNKLASKTGVDKLSRKSSAANLPDDDDKIQPINPPQISQLSLTSEATDMPVQRIQKTSQTVDKPQPEESQKVEETLPNFMTNVPYRLGLSYNVEKNGRGTQVIAESLIGKNFSVHLGYGIFRMNPVRFKDDWDFKKQTGMKFLENFPGGFVRENPKYPMMKQVSAGNIKIYTSFIRVPFGVTFREKFGRNYTFLAGLGSHITLSSVRSVRYNLYYPSKEILPVMVTDKRNQRIGHLNVTVGIEKIWNPLVLQLETFFSINSHPVMYYSDRLNPGVRAKVLVQFGPKK